MDTPTFVSSVNYIDAKAATEWLADAFGFELTMAIEDPQGDPLNSHYEMSCEGRGRVMIGGEWSERMCSPQSANAKNTQRVHVYLDDDVDAHCEHARQAGAEIVAEPSDQFYGDRTYRVLDCEGHEWSFAQQVRNVTRAQAEAAIGQAIYATNWE